MKTSAKNILVTGAAGYLGSALVPRLLEQGYYVKGIDNFLYQQTSLLPFFIHPRFTCVQADVRDRDVVKSALEDVDVIVNLAALVGAPLCAKCEKEAWEINYEAALLLDELRDPAQGYIYPNTTSGYGTHNPVEGLCTEDTPQEPISVYGRTKVQAEQELLKKENVVTYRFTTVFGLSGRVRLDLMPNDFIWKAIHQGCLVVFESHFQRSFIHVTDVAGVMVHTIQHFDEMKGRCYNVGHERMNKTKKELAEKVAALTGCYLHFNDLREDPDKRNYFISFKRIQETGWEPDHDLDTGLRSVVAGLKTLHWSIPHANVEYY